MFALFEMGRKVAKHVRYVMAGHPRAEQEGQDKAKLPTGRACGGVSFSGVRRFA